MSVSGQRSSDRRTLRIDRVTVVGGSTSFIPQSSFFVGDAVPPSDCVLCGEHVTDGTRKDFRIARPCPACDSFEGQCCGPKSWVFVCLPCALFLAGFVEGMIGDRPDRKR